MKQFKSLVFLILFTAVTSCSQGDPEAYWPELTNESKPWTRWWWMGSAVDHDNIERLLKDYSDKGIGGVEITPIYGVKGEEKNDISFLSPEWVSMLNYSVKTAGEYGMKVDMNTGTGWPFGGPQVGDDMAAKKMMFHSLGNITQKELTRFVEQMSESPDEDLLVISAYNSFDHRVNLMLSGASVNDIEEQGRELIAISQKNTGQEVKRAAPGGEGLVFNHFSEEATAHYLARFSQAFSENPGIRSFFNDSYELSEASSVSELFDTFQEIKGYDLALYAKELSGRGSKEEIARIKADYRDVLGEMLLTNFTSTWSTWARSYGALTKNQAHGSPGNLIDLYAAVDIPELETFHASDFPFLQDVIDKSDAKRTESNNLFRKFASSAAHMKGDKLVSCETFTWLNEHFKTPLYQCKAELDELFVRGVNHVFFHGTAYSPARAEWPGWLFYASSHFEPTNPQWDHMLAMNRYIGRCQSVLQTGQLTNDFLVLWSPDKYNYDAEGLEKKLTLHNSESWVSMPEIDTLLEKGYKFDFTSDRIISNSKVSIGSVVTFDKASYQCIVVPQQHRMKLNTFKNLLQLAEDGAKLVFSSMPSHVFGFKDYIHQEKELAELVNSVNLLGKKGFQSAQRGKGKIYVGNIEWALEEIGIERESLMDYKIKSISRKTQNGFYYFLANHEKEKVDEWIKFKHKARNALFLDPMNGEISQADSDSGHVHLELNPGASLILYFTNEDVKGINNHAYFREGKTMEITNPWSLKTLKGGPEPIADTLLAQLSFWTDLPHNTHKNFAGTCEYATTFHMDQLSADNYLLRFEDVEASARVFINGEEVATLWSLPFELQVGKYLRKGRNTLRVEVSNLGANRIRFLDQEGVVWKKFHNINIVNLNYKSLDASLWDLLPSGLGSKVELIELNEMTGYSFK